MFTIILTKLQINQKFINSKKKNKKNGFTLIELVAVMAIIAVLSAAFVPKISGYIENAKKVAVLNEAKNIVTAFESVSYKSGYSESTTGDELITDGILDEGSLKKLGGFSVETCRAILDTEKNDFSFDDDGNVDFTPTE
ncbi:prepilin-type N-terminal cleavage/methylation domain-containing protein [Clostridioides difficile]